MSRVGSSARQSPPALQSWQLPQEGAGHSGETRSVSPRGCFLPRPLGVCDPSARATAERKKSTQTTL